MLLSAKDINKDMREVIFHTDHGEDFYEVFSDTLLGFHLSKQYYGPLTPSLSVNAAGKAS